MTSFIILILKDSSINSHSSNNILASTFHAIQRCHFPFHGRNCNSSLLELQILTSSFVITLAIHKNKQSLINVFSIQQVVPRIIYVFAQITCAGNDTIIIPNVNWAANVNWAVSLLLQYKEVRLASYAGVNCKTRLEQ